MRVIGKVKGAVDQGFQRLERLATAVFLFFLVLEVVGSYLLYTRAWQHTTPGWYREMLLVTVIMLALATVVFYVIHASRQRMYASVEIAIAADLHTLTRSTEQFEALQSMASTLSATLSFERVIEQAVDVCALALEDLGLTRESLVGAVFLYDGERLVPLQSLEADEGRILSGEVGVVGEALKQAEPTVTDNPRLDPELQHFATFSDCLTVVSVPLRAGYRLFGAMILGIDSAVHFEDEHFELFNAVADQTVIALQNAQLFQRLEAEKQRLLEADVEARRELARDLHDGPVQKVAVIAMRLNVLRSIARQDPDRLPEEIAKLEQIAQNASQELRGMLFTLRPLLLETKGLGPAIESILLQIAERYGTATSLEGSEVGRLLDQRAQEVVFSIAEEALSNAAKHAQADHIQVTFWHEPDLFIARIQDDGIGFDPLEMKRDYDQRGSLGMVNMQERAERIDATLKIESMPASGSTITLIVPLARNGVAVASPRVATRAT